MANRPNLQNSGMSTKRILVNQIYCDMCLIWVESALLKLRSLCLNELSKLPGTHRLSNLFQKQVLNLIIHHKVAHTTRLQWNLIHVFNRFNHFRNKYIMRYNLLQICMHELRRILPTNKKQLFLATLTPYHELKPLFVPAA